MVYGWGQKFKCGGIQSYNNMKLYLDLGGKFDAGCLLDPTSSVFEPNLWHDDIIVVLQDKGDFAYRQCWGRGPGPDSKTMDYDRTRSFNNTIYVPNENVGVRITGGNCPGKSKNYTLEEFQSIGEDPGSARLVGRPATSVLMEKAITLLQGT